MTSWNFLQAVQCRRHSCSAGYYPAGCPQRIRLSCRAGYYPAGCPTRRQLSCRGGYYPAGCPTRRRLSCRAVYYPAGIQHADGSLAEPATIQQVVQHADGSLAEPATIPQESNTQTALLQSCLLFSRYPTRRRLSCRAGYYPYCLHGVRIVTDYVDTRFSQIYLQNRFTLFTWDLGRDYFYKGSIPNIAKFRKSTDKSSVFRVSKCLLVPFEVK